MRIEITNQGLVDDGIVGYELRSPHSYLRYGHETRTNVYHFYNIGTNVNDRHKGHATFLIHILFNKIKANNGILNVGHYTKSGEMYIKPVVDRLSKEYEVRIV